MSLTILERLQRIHEDEDAIYKQLGFIEDWRVYPFDNQTHVSWCQTGNTVQWFGGIATAEDIEYFKESGEAVFSAESIRGVYTCPEQGLTAFVLNTGCAGNIFFDNL